MSSLFSRRYALRAVLICVAAVAAAGSAAAQATAAASEPVSAPHEVPPAMKVAHIRLTGQVLESPPEYMLFGGTVMRKTTAEPRST